MRENWKNSIIQGIEEAWEGYSVVEIQQGSEDHVFRALVKKPTGSTKAEIQIILRESNSGHVVAYITNYAEGDDDIRVNLSSGKRVDGKDKKYSPKIDAAAYEESKKAKLKSFRKKIPKLKDNKDNPLLTKKKIKLYGKAANINSKSWGLIKNPIYVPFFNSLEDDEPCGAQIIGLSAEGKSLKTSITDSRFKAAFHILQQGEVDPVFKKQDGFICESYTTACDVAEAMPEHFVACSAGITQQMDAGKKLQVSGINIIYVLDKVVSGKPPSKDEKDMKQLGLPYIQLNVVDAKLADMTDFNDFALKFGKRALKKEIALQSHKYMTILPETLSYSSDGGFTILNPITQTVDNLKMDKLFRFLSQMCSYSTSKAFYKLNSLKGGGTGLNEQLQPILLNEVARSKETAPRGVGIFKDRQGYVLNLTQNDRYTLDEGKLAYTTKIKPFNNERYFNSPIKVGLKENTNPEILQHKFTDKEFKKLLDLWDKSFGLDRATLLLLLGFITQACYASFTKCSPHLWLRGTTGSGKSYILNNIINNLLNGLTLTLQDSTKAGIEQELAKEEALNCPLIWLDEAGMDSESKRKKVTDLIHTTREMFMGGLTPSYKGTREQVSKVYYRAFSMAMASVVDGLSDPQDIGRFLLINVSDFLLRGSEYDEVGKAFLDLNPSFLRGVFEGAQHYENLFNLISQSIEGYYRIDRSKLGHKVATLAASLAGTAVLAKVAYGWDDETCIKHVFKYCSTAVNGQLETHREKVGSEDNFIDLLRRTYFQVGEMKGRLCDLCEDSKDSEMYESFGVRLRKGRKEGNGYYTLVINKTKFKFDALLSNPKQIIGNPIYNGIARLWELKENHPDVSEERGSRYRYFIIKRFCKEEES